ncbi:Arm domain-containing protein [Cephalotus follicularis]|uniref:Arm domain-containing protein n=1 Tax=Cephalotus follicularis TaxID=3775 RepID=A0A1Q3AVI0_CEPFO|nr:Arm domain-containing protein [Cephalotus follicularis]
MPSASYSATSQRPSDLLSRLASGDGEIKLKALREVKNQIIGNRTKKLSFLKLGAVPVVAKILADDVVTNKANDNNRNNLIIQSAAALGSFACGFDAGVRAVLDAGSLPHLIRLLSNPDDKVVDSAARTLRMIYQSKLAPEYNLSEQKNIEFLVSLLNSDNENVSGLGACIITRSCETIGEKKALCDAGVLSRLITLLNGSLSQRDSSLESLATIFNGNPDAISKFVGPEKTLSCVIELVKDRYPRTRLLACTCLIVIRNMSPCYLQDVGIATKLIHVLLELLDDPGQVGDEASFVFSSLISHKEDLQKLALENSAIDRFYNNLQKVPLHPKRLQGILLALGDMCSTLESCRSKFLSLQVLNLVIDALNHDTADVRTAACICLRSVFRSIKNLSAGRFMNETVVIPLIQLSQDSCTSVQVAALGAISNIVVDFTTRKTTFIQCGGVKQLVQLSTSMDSAVRSNALWALRNFIFLADDRCKEGVFSQLSASLLTRLICDPEPSVQEQALAFVRNLVDGCIDFIDYVFAEDGIILNAVGRQLQSALKAEIAIQGMYVLSNVASGSEVHKEAVMHQLLPQVDDWTQSYMIKFLRSDDSRLRIAAVWAIVNLTCPSYLGAYGRVVKLRNGSIVSQIKNMVNDSCLDVKLHVRTALRQFMTFGDCSI